MIFYLTEMGFHTVQLSRTRFIVSVWDGQIKQTFPTSFTVYEFTLSACYRWLIMHNLSYLNGDWNVVFDTDTAMDGMEDVQIGSS